MKKSLISCALLAASAAIMFADDNAKVTFAAVEESLTVMSPTPRTGPNVASPQTRILAADIVLSSKSDLLITPSMVTAILSRTENDGFRGPTEFAQASEMITVTVRVDSVVARPGPVTYDNLLRTVSTKFAGVTPATCAVTPCPLTDEQLVEVLNVMGARSFNFFLKGIAKGKHHIEVSASFTNNDQATPTTTPVPPVSNPFASATSTANIGPRTLTVTAIPQGDNGDDNGHNMSDALRVSPIAPSGQSVAHISLSHIIDRAQ